MHSNHAPVLCVSICIILRAGYSTPAINAEFGPAALKYVLEAIPGMGTVTVETEANNNFARVCGSNYLSVTRITLDSYIGASPPRMYVVSGSSANSRFTPKGGGALSLSASLYMQTSYTLTCPDCAGCTSGVIWFAIGDSISHEIRIRDTYSSASEAIRIAIRSMSDLSDAGWENLVISVTADNDDNAVCIDGQSNSFTVDLRSNYGNLPYIEMVGNAWQGEKNPVYLTWDSDAFQEVDPLPCSGQGFCNYTAGRCSCSRFYEGNKLQFETTSSDGRGNAGGRGDCGHYKRSRLSTVSAACLRGTNITNGDRTLCSGHGVCLSEISDACTCQDGWSGIFCNIAKTCPSGPAWFDEAISSSIAHQPAVCSNMGLCDAATGRCKCRSGFHGAACQYMDCPRDSVGIPCNGQGWCMSMHKWAEIAGFEYGDEQNIRAQPAAWDAFGFHACLCSAGHPTPFSLSGRSNTDRPAVGPMSIIDGYPSETPKLPGWRGYGCQERNCPSGNRIVSPSAYSSTTAVYEEQIVGCIGENSSSTAFILSFYGHATAEITGDMNADEIKSAIEWAPTIGNVTVFFLDNIYPTACHSSQGSDSGFVVRFDTELGNIPNLQVASSSNAVMNVTQLVAGTLVRIN